MAYALATPQDMAELYLKTGTGAPRRLTDLNAAVLRGKPIGPVESFTFISNDNKYEVEAFLTKPVGLTEGLPDMAAAPKHPLIVVLHGGPHGQNGPAFASERGEQFHRPPGGDAHGYRGRHPAEPSQPPLPQRHRAHADQGGDRRASATM